MRGSDIIVISLWNDVEWDHPYERLFGTWLAPLSTDCNKYTPGDDNLYNISFNLIPSAHTYEVP